MYKETRSGSCLVSEVLEVILTELKGLFPNISSNPADTDGLDAGTDGYIFKMTRKDGTKSIFLRIKIGNRGTVSQKFTMKATDSYIPNEVPGINGSWKIWGTTNYAMYMNLTNNNNLTTQINWKLIIFDDSIIITTRIPTDTTQWGNAFFIGFTNSDKPCYDAQIGIPFMALQMSPTATINYQANITGMDSSGGTMINSLKCKTDVQLISKQLNGKILLNQLYVTEGDNYYLGELEGIYAMAKNGVLATDLINIDSQVYEVFTHRPNSFSLFPDCYLAVRIQ